MKKFSFIFISFSILLILFFFASCEREPEHHDLSVSDVNIVISSPNESQEFEAGDTVNIKGAIDAPEEMHGYEVHLTRLSDNTEVMNKTYGTNAKHYDFSETFINDGIVHSDMSLEIVAITDHSGTKTSKKVQFHCHEK
ncbi:MAG: hypothetical protein PSX81_14285 [bacterium]|nr:hypothetical protein [bacterium]